MRPNEVMMSFLDRQRAVDDAQSQLRLALALRFINTNPMVERHGAEQCPGVVNDLRGPDSRMTHTGIPQFRDVVYGGLWPGIDLRVREQSGVLKYEFHVAPGAAPSDVQLAYAGANSLAVGADGGLQISTAIGVLQDAAPVSYQDIDGARVPVSTQYVVGNSAPANGRFSFEVGQYQKDHELIIDPGVQ